MHPSSLYSNSLRLDSSGIEFWWGKIFRNRPHQSWKPSSLLYNGYRLSSPGVKRPERNANHPLHLETRYSYTSPPSMGIHVMF